MSYFLGAVIAEELGAKLAKATRRTTSAASKSVSLLILPLVKKYVFVFLLLVIAPLVISTLNYLLGDRRGNWQTADRTSAGLLPDDSSIGR